MTYIAPQTELSTSPLATSILPQILSQLDLPSLLSCTLVSHSFHTSASSSSLWSSLLSHTWSHGTLSHSPLFPPLFAPSLSLILPPNAPLPTSLKALVRARTLIDKLAIRALETWSLSKNSAERSACIDTISALGALVYEKLAKALLTTERESPEAWIAVRAACWSLVPTMQRALAMDGWRKVGEGDKGEIDWIARSFAPFLHGQTDLWLIEALDEALCELAHECQVAFEKELADSGHSTALTAGAIAESLWRSLKTRGYSCDSMTFTTGSCFLSLLLLSPPAEPKVVSPITMATLLHALALRLSGPYALDSDIYLAGIQRVAFARVNDPTNEWFYIDLKLGVVRPKVVVDKILDINDSETIVKDLLRRSRIPATARDVLEEMSRALWHAGSPEDLGTESLISSGDASIVLLSLISLFPPSSPTPIDLPLPLSKAFVDSTDLYGVQSHLLHYVADPDQRAEITSCVTEALEVRNEPLLGEQGQVKRREGIDGLEFRVGDVVKVEQQGEDEYFTFSFIGAVISWGILDLDGTPTPFYCIMKPPGPNSLNAAPDITEVHSSRLSRINETDDWLAALDQLETSPLIGLVFRARDYDSDYPRYLLTGACAETFPDDA